MSVPEVPDRAPPGRLARMPKVVTGLVGVMALIQAGMTVAPLDARMWVFDHFAVSSERLDALLFSASYPEAAAMLIGHAFLHGNGVTAWFGWLHLFFNAMLLLMAGEVVAERYGRDLGGALRFLALFAICAVAGALLFLALNANAQVGVVGASGAACGLFVGYLMGQRADWRESLRYPAIRGAAFQFLIANVGLAAVARMWGVLPIAWEAHLGGFIAGAIFYPLLLPRQPAPVWR